MAFDSQALDLSEIEGFFVLLNRWNYQEISMRYPLITAAFFMEGLHDARPDHNVNPNYDALIETWDKGCIELVDSLVSYVPVTIKLCEAGALANDGVYPGVFDYEVSSCFGRWFGEHILEHGGDEPPQKEAYAWLVKEVGAFFIQGTREEQAEDVKTAINEVFVLAMSNSTALMPS